MTLTERIQTIRTAAENLDTSNTTSKPIGALAQGDVVLSVGPKTFPFPFTIKTAKTYGTGVMLTATHGWMNVSPYPATDLAVVVA